MKTQFKRSRWLQLLIAVVLLIGLMGVLTPPEAQAQVTPVTYSTILGPTNVLGAATTNINSGEFDVWQDRGLSVFLYGACTNASGSNVVVNWSVSYDGTNWSTDAPGLTWTIPNNGTTAIRAWTNYPAAALTNVKKARVRTIQNVHLSTFFITNMVRSVRSP